MRTTMTYSQENGAPELFDAGKYDTKYNIFVVGVVAYQMVVGCLPFKTKNRIKVDNSSHSNRN